MKPNKEDCGLCVNYTDSAKSCNIDKDVDTLGWCKEFDNKHILKSMMYDEYIARFGIEVTWVTI
jgi:hypothetical protein